MTFIVMSVSALAAPGTGACVQANQDLFVAVMDAGSPGDTESGNLGNAISDGFFGNEPNLPNSDNDMGPEEHNAVDPGSVAGDVSPSLSPGPHVNGGGFTTLGSLIKGQTAALCS